MTFEKGKSGNPGGRPKDVGPIKELAKIHAPKAIDTLAKAMGHKNVRARIAASEVILDRAYGKATQHHEIDAGDELVKRMDAARKKLTGEE